MTHPHHIFTDILKGAAGLLVNFLALLTSTQEHLEWGLRCLSLIVGIIVGIATVISLLRKKKSQP